MYRSLKLSNSVRFSIKSHNYSYRVAAILNITRFQTATYVFLEAENIPKTSGQVACFLQKVPTGLYICTHAAALQFFWLIAASHSITKNGFMEPKIYSRLV